MNNSSKYSIIALLSMGIVAAGVFGFTSPADNFTPQETADRGGSIVFNSYITVDKMKMKELSEKIVSGEIINKYDILQHRDKDGNYIQKGSTNIAENEIYTVYELHRTDVIKHGETDPVLVKFKVDGGTIDGFTVVNGDVPEFEIGDHVLVFLGYPYDGENHEIISGEFGIYKITDGVAKNFNTKISIAELKNLLR